MLISASKNLKIVGHFKFDYLIIISIAFFFSPRIVWGAD